MGVSVPAAAACLGLAAVGVSAALSAQQAAAPQSTFRTGVDVVQVDVSVLDRDRNPVSGLTAADFTIRVDGKPVSIAAFTPVTISPRVPRNPASAAWTADIATDVATSSVPREGRLVVILFDQTIKSIQQPAARQIAVRAVDALGRDDLAAVVHVLGGTPQNFTSDRSRLLKAINNPFIGLGDGEEWINSDPTSRSTPLSRSAYRNSPTQGNCGSGSCSLEVVTQIAESLRDAPRRKIMLFITTGPPVQVRLPGVREDDTKVAREKLFRALEVANLTIHVLDPTGLETLAPGADYIGRISPNRLPVTEENLLRWGDVTTLPARTGGRTVTNANKPEEYLPALFKESQSYYALGFLPDDPRADGRLHDIDVRVNRKNVSVYARKGYYAPGGATPKPSLSIPGAPSVLADTVTASWPKPDLPMRVSVSAFAAPGEARPIAIVVVGATRSPNAVSEARKGSQTNGGAREGQVDVLVAAFDRNGQSVNFQRQTLEITNGTDAEFEYEVLSRLPLEPGRYEIRVATDDGSAKQTGSVFTYVEVPDFGKAPLSVSAVALDASPGAMAVPETAFTDVLPIVPTARREFARSDRVRAFLRVYEGGGDELRPVKLSARIQGEDGQSVFEDRVEIAANQFGASRAADYLRELPLETLAAGQYLLTIEVIDRARSERRDVRFTVR